MCIGLDDEEQSVAHVHFVGMDKDLSSGDMYAASVPVSACMLCCEPAVLKNVTL